MSRLRTALLHILFDGMAVRESYVGLIRSLVEAELEVSCSYEFFDGERKREGIVYRVGHQEVFWLKASGAHPQQMLVPDPCLRENLLDLLAVHPMYAKWFGH